MKKIPNKIPHNFYRSAPKYKTSKTLAKAKEKLPPINISFQKSFTIYNKKFMTGNKGSFSAVRKKGRFSKF